MYMCNQNIFEEDSERCFYLAGFIAADGCVLDPIYGSKVLSITISDKDENFLLSLKEAFDSNHTINYQLIKNSMRNPKWKDTRNVSLRISSNKIANDLEKFNIFPRKTKTYTFPKWLVEHPLVHHFMRGYNDGDGSFYLNRQRKNHRVALIIRGTVGFLTVYRDILEQHCGLNKINNIHVSNNCGRLDYCGNDKIAKIASFLYKDASLFLNRKKERAFISYTLKVSND
jgi:hypothetical protein